MNFDFNFKDLDWKPLALVPLLALLALPLVGSGSTWLTLTVAGLAMGMIVFIIASGLTLVFGLMDVLNFGHGVFIALGAFVATSVLGSMTDWTQSAELWRNLVAVFPAMLVAMAVAGALGLAFERFIVRPVYGQHLKQILITMGGMIIGEELIKVIWGPQQIALPMPEALRGSLLLGDASIERYRVVAVLVGVAVFALLAWTLSRTKIGRWQRIARRHAPHFQQGVLVPAYAIGLCAEQMAERVLSRHRAVLPADHPLQPLLARVLHDEGKHVRLCMRTLSLSVSEAEMPHLQRLLAEARAVDRSFGVSGAVGMYLAGVWLRLRARFVE